MVVFVMKEFMGCAGVYILWSGKGVLDSTVRECVVRGLEFPLPFGKLAILVSMESPPLWPDHKIRRPRVKLGPLDQLALALANELPVSSTFSSMEMSKVVPDV